SPAWRATSRASSFAESIAAWAWSVAVDDDPDPPEGGLVPRVPWFCRGLLLIDIQTSSAVSAAGVGSVNPCWLSRAHTPERGGQNKCSRGIPVEVATPRLRRR